MLHPVPSSLLAVASVLSELDTMDFKPRSGMLLSTGATVGKKCDLFAVNVIERGFVQSPFKFYFERASSFLTFSMSLLPDVYLK